jgi:hypothetical protein
MIVVAALDADAIAGNPLEDWDRPFLSKHGPRSSPAEDAALRAGIARGLAVRAA